MTPRVLTLTLFSLILGAALGLASALFALERGLGFGQYAIGVWTFHPRAAGPEADPYSRAALARNGALPLATGEGASFVARTDAAGMPLTGACSYRLSGTTPPARAWTLAIFDPDGGLVANGVGRYGLTAQEIVRAREGGFEIAISAAAMPGNWLPLGPTKRFLIVLNLYDTPVNALGVAIDPASLPRLVRTGCRP
jgi:hypothetical protein